MIKTEGIILSEIRFKETSKILKVYTKKLGKISIMAQGAYRPKSQLIATTQPFAQVEFHLRPGRNMYYISQADLMESFYSIRENMDRLTYGFYILELLEKSVPEEEENEKLFFLLEKGLQYLSSIEEDYLKFITAYEIKYISFIGYRPHIDSCVACNKPLKGRIKFSNELGGLLCSQCLFQDIRAKNIDRPSILAMKDLLYSRFEEIPSLTISKDLLIKIHEILVDYILYCIDIREFKSLSLVKNLMSL